MNVNQTLRTLALASMLGLSACASNSAPATWEKETLNIEVFATSDISQETINQVEEGLNVAIDLWGNPGPIEYWLIGTDEDAMEALADEYCQRRDDRGDFDKADCLEDTLANRDHGYRSYLEIGQEAVASQQASSNMGRNGHSQWGFHAYTSSIPLGFEGLLGTAPEEDQRGILHEFFHALQHGSFPPNVSRDDADDLMGPIWFVEGGAEYMAQTGLVQAHESGALASFSGGDSGWPGFATQMSWKLSEHRTTSYAAPASLRLTTAPSAASTPTRAEPGPTLYWPRKLAQTHCGDLLPSTPERVGPVLLLVKPRVAGFARERACTGLPVTLPQPR
ncbi:MAG: hypothetical protein ABR66_04370 [Microbacteriaceae bacterium BACL25 MAG-120322-bin65]|nr:MAG: hypothetical protein ABR66_04370 [Microbacteriaceae bacterium BACL25 MAG-120322-bin65]